MQDLHNVSSLDRESIVRSQVDRNLAAELGAITMFFWVAMGEGQQNQRALEFVLTIQIPSLRLSPIAN